MYSPRRLQHYTIDHGRLIGDQPVQPYLLDCISKLVEIHGLLDVAVCAQAITIHEIPLFFRGSHYDHGDSLGPRIAFDLPEDFDSIHLGATSSRAAQVWEDDLKNVSRKLRGRRRAARDPCRPGCLPPAEYRLHSIA